MRKTLALTVALAAIAVTSQAAMITNTVEYREGDTVLEGYIAYDDAIKGKRPGVLVVHEWKGLSDYEKKRARMLAGLGYVALAADIYGKGVRARDNREASSLSSRYRSDRNLLRRRVNAGLAALKGHFLVDASRTAAIGYCFGGTAVLELARSGAKVNGVVSFHGGLGTPTPEDARNITAKVLALHGANDPNVDEVETGAFRDEMRKGNVDWQMIYYGGAVHSFTNPASGNDPSRGVAYNEKADRRSWAAMKLFFTEIF